MRGEYSIVTLDSKHEAIDERDGSFFFAPSLSGTYKLAENQDLSLALSRRIGRPTYPQLTPYMSMVDATTYEQGNMHLKPEKATKVDLSYNLRSEVVTLFANGYLNYTTDYISQITQAAYNHICKCCKRPKNGRGAITEGCTYQVGKHLSGRKYLLRNHTRHIRRCRHSKCGLDQK